MKFEWTKNTGVFSSGETYNVGPFPAGSYHYGVTSKNDPDPKPYVPVIHLPGVKFKSETRFKTPAEAKACVERAVMRWFQRIED